MLLWSSHKLHNCLCCRRGKGCCPFVVVALVGSACHLFRVWKRGQAYCCWKSWWVVVRSCWRTTRSCCCCCCCWSCLCSSQSCFFCCLIGCWALQICRICQLYWNWLLGAYMHHTLNTSLIYFNIYPIHSNSYQNIKNYSKIFFLNFLYFYSLLFECPFIFLSYILYEGLYFASTSRFDSELRSAYKLVGST